MIFIFTEWSCDATTGLRTFVENERKKSNGNVCCRSSVSVRSEDDYEYDIDEYETDDNNYVNSDTESKKSYCSERSGYRYTNKALSIYKRFLINVKLDSKAYNNHLFDADACQPPRALLKALIMHFQMQLVNDKVRF